MAELKIQVIGEGLGVTLPKEVVEQLHLHAGDSISLERLPHGTYRLANVDDKLSEQMELIEGYMHEEDA
ncbi:AbrB/MazE/SpoVT family DNA-binding domain-containing protein [Shewanella sp. MBTL60-007]|uniref:AbrB/MazE/SpoVT family DNA-binding domain-containing protein n=1 Tax=Shewanella sp. MBTL60-007 TaxID=2815911 RepID=UPI001C7FE7F7|nr:AbrB/MazE/SpoVT family DNA-binding domain-containing protein [Shewanella sp. MBTL60-007]